MPKVPVQEAQFSTNLPGVPNMPYTREFGRIGEAAQQAGQAVQQGATDFTDQMVRAEANDAASNAYASDKLWADNKIADLKLQSPDGYMHKEDGSPILDSDGNRRTIADEFHDQADQRFQNAQTNMPNLMAQEAYKNRSLPYFSDQMGMLITESQSMKVKAYDQNQEMRTKALGGDPTQTPFNDPRTPFFTDMTGKAMVDPNSGQPMARLDTSKFYKNLQDIHQDNLSNIGIMHNATDAQGKFTLLGHSLTDETVRNMYTNVLDLKKSGDKTNMTQDVWAVYNLLGGTDPESQDRASKGLPTLSSTMDPVKREVQMDKFLRLLPQAKTNDKWNLEQQFEDTKAAQKMGVGDQATFQGMANNIGAFGRSDPEKNGPKAVSMMGELFSAHTQGLREGPEYYAQSNAQRAAWAVEDQNKAFHGAQQFAGALNVPLAGDMGGRIASSMHSDFAKTQEDIRSDVSKDPVDFASRVRPEWGNSSNQTGRSVLPTGKAFSQIDMKNPAALSNSDASAYSNFAKQFNQYKSGNWSDMIDHSQMPVTKQQGKDFASKLLNEPNSELAASDVNGLYRLYKKDAPGNIDQMVKDGALPYQYRLMGLHLHDPNALTYTLDCLNGAVAQEAYFKANRGAENGGALKPEMIRDSVQKVSGTWVQAYTQGEPNSEQRTKDAANLQNAIYIGALKELRDPNVKDQDQAAQLAFQKLTNNSKVLNMGQQHFWQGDRPISQTSVIPDTYNGKPIGDSQAVTIAQNLDQQRHHFKLGDVALPPNGQGGRPANDPDGSHYIDYINNNSKAAFSNSPEPGHYFFYKSKDGYQYKVLGQDMKPLFVPLSKSLIPASAPPAEKPLPLPMWNGNPGGGRAPGSVGTPTIDAENHKSEDQRIALRDYGQTTPQENERDIQKARTNHLTGGAPVSEYAAKSLVNPGANRTPDGR